METEELRLKLFKIRDGAAGVCRTAEEALALLPAPEGTSRGYEGDVVGHLRDIAGRGMKGASDGAEGVSSPG